LEFAVVLGNVHSTLFVSLDTQPGDLDGMTQRLLSAAKARRPETHIADFGGEAGRFPIRVDTTDPTAKGVTKAISELTRTIADYRTGQINTVAAACRRARRNYFGHNSI
jgi:hypothetical protein